MGSELSNTMISIIIPAYNEEKYLEKTLKSIHEQTTDDYETIVVANGCTDNTGQIAQRYADRTFSINKANVSLARNIGALHAKGDILLFLDADTRLAPNTLKEINAQFNSSDAVATLIGRPNSAKLRYKLALALLNARNQTKIYRGSIAGTIITHKAHFDNTPGFNTRTRLKENVMLIHKLLKFGNYRVIKNTHATISTRRYERWGLPRTVLFWVINGAKVRFFHKDSYYEAVR